VCRCTPGLWPITPLQLKVLLQAGVADLFPVGGSGLRCAADFLAGGSMGWGCLGFACCCSQAWGAGRHTWQMSRPLPYSVYCFLLGGLCSSCCPAGLIFCLSVCVERFTTYVCWPSVKLMEWCRLEGARLATYSCFSSLVFWSAASSATLALRTFDVVYGAPCWS